MKRYWGFVIFIVMAVARAPAADTGRLTFERDIRPILESACGKCHGPQKQQGGLRFDQREGAFKPGDSGLPAIVPGRIESSELIRRLEATDASERMPLESPPLAADQIKMLRTWIEEGAEWPGSAPLARPERRDLEVTDEDRQHWSYRPLQAVRLPPVRDTAWCRTPIDRFILAALEAKPIEPNPSADRRTLVRRAYFDVIGLPPSPAETEAFVNDASHQAYDHLVDRLLASPHYGERWGRHWLDLARYADSDGMELDADRPDAYHYRDFVIRAFNDDLSYQTFVRWQLAGDEYEPDNPLAQAATGFLTGAPCERLTDMHLEEERLRLRYNELDDMAATTASAFLGLTLACARCHDHKFDAIPTRDYYRIQCAFTTTSRDNVLLATRSDAARYREAESHWQQRLTIAQDQLNTWLTDQQQPLTATLRSQKIDSLSISDEQKQLLKDQPDSEAAKRLAKQHQKVLTLSEADYRAVFSEEQRQQWDALKRDLAAVQKTKPQSPPTALAIKDLQSEPKPTWLLARGDFFAREEPIQLGFLSVMTRGRSPADYWSAAHRESASEGSTKQRRALAEWMTDADQGAGPLLARVIVNRVWQHHFGEGLVRTASDFGVRGERPSHPDLLEWLTHDFVTNGWRLKRLHRMILTSSVYLQASTFDEARSRHDPENRLLWRRRPVRLESEAIRDAVLAVSGTLNAAPFGPAFKPPIPPEAIVARNTKSPYPQDARDTPATRRRSVYMFHKRVTPHPLMQVFDGPDAAVSCGLRNSTTVAPQALALLNDAFIRDRAEDFARRLMTDDQPSPEQWIENGFRLGVARAPTDAECAASLRFVASQRERRAARNPGLPPNEVTLQSLADFCQALFSLNEFVYVD